MCLGCCRACINLVSLDTLRAHKWEAEKQLINYFVLQDCMWCHIKSMTHQRDSIEFSIFLEGGAFHFFKSLTYISPKCWKMVILTEVLTCVMEIKTTTVLTVLMYLWNSFLESNDVTYITLFLWHTWLLIYMIIVWFWTCFYSS